MSPHRLSPEQIQFFHTFGYLGFPGLLADRNDEITSAFETIWQEHGGGHHGQPHTGEARSCIVPFIDQHQTLCSLLDDERILAIATSLLGTNFNYMGSDGNYYVGDTQWHSDGWKKSNHPIHLKIALYLDPLTRDTGALRVIPGSHLYGKYPQDVLADPAAPHPDEVLLCGEEGTVVVWNSHLWHGTTANRSEHIRHSLTSFFCRRDDPHMVFSSALSEEAARRLSPEARCLFADPEPWSA